MTTYKNYGWTIMLLAAPLLAACGGEEPQVAKHSAGITVPACQSGQVVSLNSTGELVCRDLPTGFLTLPVCDKDLGAVTGNGKRLECSNRNLSDANVTQQQQKLIDIRNKVNDLSSRVDVVASKGGKAPVYKGVTDTATKGAIASGQATGVVAAAELCKTKFGAGAHMCTPYEMYHSVATGVITSATSVPQSWIYMMGWNTPVASPTEPLNGLNENCAGYTYGTGDQKWVGTTVKWEVVAFTNRQALKFVGGSGSPCNQSFPIACCQ